jgi:hypothetical protein
MTLIKQIYTDLLSYYLKISVNPLHLCHQCSNYLYYLR